jgi:hypothetical protein
MATNMAPHNLSESIDAICAYIDDREITIDDLMKHIIARISQQVVSSMVMMEFVMLSTQEEDVLF